MDRLESYRVFVSVADHRGFAAAARQLGLSAPAVTRALAALEDHLGARLLHRTTRTVQLTDVGARFLDDCRRIVGEIDTAEAEAAGAHVEPTGRLSVTAPLLFGRLHIAPIVFDFMEHYPRVAVRTFFADRIVNLHDDGIDVALRIAPLPDSGLHAVRVGAVRRVLVASPSYLDRRGVPASPAALHEHDAIGFSQSGAWTPRWKFERSGDTRPIDARPRMALVTNTNEVAIAAARAGKGLVRVFSYQVADDLAEGRLRRVLTDWEPEPTPVHLVTPEGRRASAAVRAFVAYAAERLASSQALRELAD